MILAVQYSEVLEISYFFMAQLNNPTHGDWATEVLEDIEYLDLNMELEDIKIMSKNKFRSIVKVKTKQKALEYLLEKKGSRNSEHAKGKLLSYNEMKMADYLSPSQVNISIQEKKWILKFRVEDIDISCNNRWKNENLYCSNCISTEMDQKHLLLCKSLLGKNEIVANIPVYEDIYSEDIAKQVNTSRILKKHFIRMKHLEDQVNRVDSQ